MTKRLPSLTSRALAIVLLAALLILAAGEHFFPTPAARPIRPAPQPAAHALAASEPWESSPSLIASPAPTTASASPVSSTSPAPNPAPAARPAEVARDITYARPLQADLPPQKLDIYVPAGAVRAPVVVFLHGRGGDKADYRALGEALTAKGMVVFAANWPDSGAAQGVHENGQGFRQVFESVACAVRFARARAPDYGGDPGRVTLLGFSAGASLGAAASFAGDDVELPWDEFAAGRGAPPAQATCVAGAGPAHADAFVGVAGRYGQIFQGLSVQNDDPELWRVVSPFAHISNCLDVRIRLLHGAQDAVVPIGESYRFFDALVTAGYDVTMTGFEGGHDIPLDLTVDEIVRLWK